MKNLCVLLSILLLSGCYKDKGNYDYEQLNEIIISGIDENETYYFNLGEPFTMPEPIITFSDSTNAHNDLSYQWKLDNKVVSTEKVLNVEVPIKPGETYYVGEFSVKDERTGIAYIQKFRFNVLYNFTMGWMWLVENNGRVEMNMMTTNQKFYPDVFTSINGEELGSDAYQLVEHWSSTTYAWYSGVLAVAGENSVEVDDGTLSREAWMSEEFTGGVLPEGFHPVAAAFTKNYSCVVGDNGKVHIRHSEGGYLYEGRYPSMPFYSDFKISPKVAWANPPAYNVALFFDENTDSYVYLNSYGELCRFDEVIDEGGAFETVNMNKDLVYIATVEQNESNSIFYAIVRDKSTQKYYSQQFEFGITGTSAYLRTISEKEFPDIIDENTCFSVGYKTTDVWYSKGSILYKYNRELNDTPVKYKDFETGDIKAIAFNAWGDQYGVIVENGDRYDFYWEDTYGTSYQGQTGLTGEVKSLIYKVGMEFYYE